MWDEERHMKRRGRERKIYKNDKKERVREKETRCVTNGLSSLFMRS